MIPGTGLKRTRETCLRLPLNIALLMTLGLFAMQACAHEQALPSAAGFTSGFMHPLLGADHVLAMVAVGLWGAQLGNPALWLLPVTFPLMMAAGGVLGIQGVPLPGVEPGIAASGLVLGLMIAFAVRAPLWLAGGLVGAFAVFHGYAHGVELPGAASPLTYSLGFVIATGMLHFAGIGIGSLNRSVAGARITRLAGLAIACGGMYFLRAAVA